MPLVVYTARLPHPKGAYPGGYKAMDMLDVTRGTGDIGSTFAPSRKLLNAAQACKRKAGKVEADLDLVFEWYALLYVEEMRLSFKRRRSDWEALLSHDVVTICCYCSTARRCHRRLLAEILVRLGAEYRGER